MESDGPGPVEAAVQKEISGLAAEVRPGLAQAAIAMARILDNPQATNQQPAAAKVLAALLDRLRVRARSLRQSCGDSDDDRERRCLITYIPQGSYPKRRTLLPLLKESFPLAISAFPAATR